MRESAARHVVVVAAEMYHKNERWFVQLVFLP